MSMNLQIIRSGKQDQGIKTLAFQRISENMSPLLYYKIVLCILISFACCNSSNAFPESCQKSGNQKEVTLASGHHPRMRLDLNFIFITGESDGVKMMRKFTEHTMVNIDALGADFNKWVDPYVSVRETRDGLEEVCNKYDSDYKDAFPYSCYTKANWCFLKEFYDQLFQQLGTIWKTSGPTLVLTQPWFSFFNPPDHTWRDSLINEMKMACETFFHHPLLGSMTKTVRQNSDNLKTKIINRIYYFVEKNQHENLKAFLERFEWIKQAVEDPAAGENDEFVRDVNRLLRTGNSMIIDLDSFNWDFTLPVPRTREVIAMLWLVIPKSVRDLFPSPTSNEIVLERVKRFHQINFDNVLDKSSDTLKALIRHTVNLKSQVKDDCNEASDMNGLECAFSRVLEDLGKLVEVLKKDSWQSSSTLDLRSANLISFLSTGAKEFIEVTFPKLREILIDAFERFYGYAKQNDVSGLESYTKLMPPLELLSIGTERDCSEFIGDLKSKIPCLFQNVFREVILYINSLKVAPLNTKIISTTFNFRDRLRGAQLSAISAQIDQRAIEAQANLEDFVNEIKSFVSKETGQRFTALEGYFKGIADFDQRKANADIGYITGRLKSFDETVRDLQPSLEEKLTAVVIGSVTSSTVDTLQKGVELAVKATFACNPLDPDPGAVFDAANDFAQSIVNLARSSKLANTFKTAFNHTSSVGTRLSENNEFIKSVREIVKTLPEKLKDNVEFSKMTTEFLTKYSDYDPKVKRGELAKIGTDWELFLQEACDTLYKGETTLPAIVQTTFAGLGHCLTTQGDLSNMMEIFSEIYDYQYELMETLATAVRAYQSQFFANRLDTNLRLTSQQDLSSEEDDKAINLHQTMLSLYLIYRVHTLQIVVQHCNYLQFKNAGEMPSVCQNAMRTLEQRSLSNLIAFQGGKCTPESFKFVDIPTTKSNDDESTSWINMTRLYQGEEVPFQIPSFEWLVENNWITRADARDTAIYLSAFEMFLPNVSPEKERKRSRHFIKNHKVTKVSAGISDQITNAREIGVRKNTSKNPIVRRASGEQRDIQFRITAKYPAPLFPGDKAVGYNLQPFRMYVFAYQENSGSCRQSTIDNPYSKSLPRICPLSSPPNPNQVDPSIFSLWKVKLEAPVFDSVPRNIGSGEIKAAVRICKVKKPSTLSKRKAKKKKKKKKKKKEE